MEERKWEDLETDCLVNILGRVGIESLLLDVPFICKSWYKASFNPLCWGHIIFPNIEFGFWHDDFFVERLINTYRIDRDNFHITAFIKSIVNRSCKSATMLILPSFCTEEALKYAANECPTLRILGLPYELCYKQEHIIPELMVKWKNLEVLMLGCSNNLKEILAQISLHCKNFKEIRVENANINKKEASAIVTLLPNIKQLLLRGAYIDREDLLMILQGCKELSHLDVSDCVGFEIDDEILELASNIQTFKYEGSRLDDDDDDDDDDNDDDDYDDDDDDDNDDNDDDDDDDDDYTYDYNYDYSSLFSTSNRI